MMRAGRRGSPSGCGRRISRSKLARTEWANARRCAAAGGSHVPDSGLARNWAFLSLIGFIVLLMSISMSMPIPLTNMALSFVIFVLAAGILRGGRTGPARWTPARPRRCGYRRLGGVLRLDARADAVEAHAKPMIKGWLGME